MKKMLESEVMKVFDISDSELLGCLVDQDIVDIQKNALVWNRPIVMKAMEEYVK